MAERLWSPAAVKDPPLRRAAYLTPIGRVVDFSQPDPASGRPLQDLVEAYLNPRSEAARKPASEELQRTFHLWIATAPKLDTFAATHPAVAEMSVRRQQLVQLGVLGIEAMSYLESGTSPSGDWTATQQALLTRAAQHIELVEFVVLDPVQRLLAATKKAE